MIKADWIAIGLLLLFALIGSVVGFGKGLRFFTKGIFGVVISVVVCYFFLGVVLSWGFVQDLVAKLNSSILGDGDNGFLVWLVESAGISKIICAIILFLIVQLIRIIIVSILKSVLESEFILIKIINKTLGVVLFVCVLVMLGLFVFHIIDWIGGSTETDLLNSLTGSALKLDYLFQNNPLRYILN